MTLQAVRTLIEQPILAAFAAASPAVPAFVENQEYGEYGATSEFALVRLQWGMVTEDMIGCAPGELLRGALVIELFTPKGVGPGRAQTVITPVLTALRGLSGIAVTPAVARVSKVMGPTFTSLDGRPHLMTRLSATVTARYDTA